MVKTTDKKIKTDSAEYRALVKDKNARVQIRSHPELMDLAFNPTNNDYVILDKLKDTINKELYEKLDRFEDYPDTGSGELLLNYDVQFRKQIDEINKLKQINGDMMDDKDIELLQNKIEKSFAAGMADVVERVDNKISSLVEKVEGIDKQAKQTCKDGNCTIDAIKGLKKDINDITVANDDKLNKLESNITEMNENINTKNNETIDGINEKIETICTGVDCLTKISEDKENTVTCPNESCKGKFVWNNQTHCPHCGIALEPIP